MLCKYIIFFNTVSSKLMGEILQWEWDVANAEVTDKCLKMANNMDL